MQFRVEVGATASGGYAELGIIANPAGQEFSALGAVVDSERLACYWGKDDVTATTWNGERIGTIRVISSRPAVFFGWRSSWGEEYFYVRVTLDRDGSVYACRGFGKGMLLTGKRMKTKRED